MLMFRDVRLAVTSERWHHRAAADMNDR